MEMIERYSADAVRYWAASTGPGKDAVISEEKIQLGVKLVTKLWNVARFSQRFLADYHPPKDLSAIDAQLTPADRWMLARSQVLIRRVTKLLEGYEYAAAKSEIEVFFWRDLADNYLEMCKQRLYDLENPGREAARFSLYQALLIAIKLFAPFLPYITEELYRGLFAYDDGKASIHLSSWPIPNSDYEDAAALALGERLKGIAIAVRRYKSENNLSLGSELSQLQLQIGDIKTAQSIGQAADDLKSITRARQVTS